MDPNKKNPFIERLSTILVIVSALGAAMVLVDPIIAFNLADGTSIRIGGTGFSDQLKGAVVSLILVSGFAAVIAYWLGASNQGDKAQDSVNAIAQAAPTPLVPVVPAEPIVTDTVHVDAQTATVTEVVPPTTEGNKP